MRHTLINNDIHTMVWSGDREPRHAVITVAKQLDAEAACVLGQSIKSSKEIIEDLDEFPGVTSGRETCTVNISQCQTGGLAGIILFCLYIKGFKHGTSRIARSWYFYSVA